MELSQALVNDKPTLILFTPVEMCQIRYCLQPEVVVQELDAQYADQINLVVAPVYAVDTPEQPQVPVIDWGVYLVEPYASWMPELEHTQFGWGLSEPELVLVDADSAVVYRSGESFRMQELTLAVGRLAVAR